MYLALKVSIKYWKIDLGIRYTFSYILWATSTDPKLIFNQQVHRPNLKNQKNHYSPQKNKARTWSGLEIYIFIDFWSSIFKSKAKTLSLHLRFDLTLHLKNIQYIKYLKVNLPPTTVQTLDHNYLTLRLQPDYPTLLPTKKALLCRSISVVIRFQ